MNREVIIADWQYSVDNEKWESSRLFQEKGFDVICCPFDSLASTSKAIETASDWEMYGFMKTTWHTLHSKNMVQIIHSGWGACDGMMNCSYPVYSSFVDRVAGMLRKIRPQIDDYAECGWKEEQIEI